MRKVVVQSGQTFADLAVQEYGSFEAAVELAIANDMSITDHLQGGSELKKIDKTYSKPVEDYCKVEGAQPTSTIQLEDGTTSIYTQPYTYTFD